MLAALLLIGAGPAQAQTETVLHNFTGAPDGANPLSRLTSDGAGDFYGTTDTGGLGSGTVFELSPNGSGGWNETVLYNFCSAPNGADGANPKYSYVMFDSVGNLYGTAYSGGANGSGVVYELSPAGTSWTETALYSFAGGVDGAGPVNGLIIDKAGNLFGTTLDGGSGGGGTVFELSPSGGGWTHEVLYAPDRPSGYGINAALTMDSAGNIFGVTYTTAFELSPDGEGGWNPTVIHTFTGVPKDGYGSTGTPVLDKAGNLYGTTGIGGAKNYGTVYKMSPITKGRKKGTWKEKILYSFKGGKRDGSETDTGVVLDTAGNIYGTTTLGGKSNVGTAFELVAPVGTGSYKEKVLWIFNGTDGEHPFGGLILDGAGNLYGTTYGGGANGFGNVFEITP